MALLAGGTLPARDGLYALDFVAGTGVLDKATDVDDAIVAGVGALEAGLVRLYGVVIVVMGVYPSRVHSSLVLSVGRVPGCATTCGAIFLSTDTLSHITVENAIATRDNSLMVLSRLKEHRRRRGLTQMELAKLSDVGRATIAAIETGKRKRVHPATARRLARALKVKLQDLG